MTNAGPIACTLDAAERPRRQSDIRSLGRDGLLSVDRGARRAVLRFRLDSGIRERVEAIASAEVECCAFLTFEVADRDEATTLTIVAPAGGETLMHELASMFADE
ncbi:MAG TPA: hypothetical protein VFQ12_00680 [Thermoleophilaceae bacterium]|nr:hypothetical protein [Thermoleophilaceae bacterium]